MLHWWHPRCKSNSTGMRRTRCSRRAADMTPPHTADMSRCQEDCTCLPGMPRNSWHRLWVHTYPPSTQDTTMHRHCCSIPLGTTSTPIEKAPTGTFQPDTTCTSRRRLRRSTYPTHSACMLRRVPDYRNLVRTARVLSIASNIQTQLDTRGMLLPSRSLRRTRRHTACTTPTPADSTIPPRTACMKTLQSLW